MTHLALAMAVLALAGTVPTVAAIGLRPVTIFLAPLVGGLVAGFAAACELILGGSLIGWFSLLVALLSVGCALTRWRRRTGAGADQPIGPMHRLLDPDHVWGSPWTWITVVVIGCAAAWPLRALQTPVIAYDAKFIWTLHSLLIYGGHQTYLAALRNPQYGFSNPDYPPLVSAAGSVGFSTNGGPNLHLAVGITAVLNSCALAVAACGIASIPRRAAAPAWSKAAAIAVGAALCLVGFGLDEPYAVGGYADLLWAAGALAAVVYGLLLPRSTHHLVIAWICATVAALTKNEGLIVALVLLAFVSIRYVPADRYGPNAELAATTGRWGNVGHRAVSYWLVRFVIWLVLALPALLWPLLMKHEQIRSDFIGGSGQSFGERLHLTASGVADNLHVFPIAVAVAIAGGFTLRRTRERIGVGSSFWVWAMVGVSVIALAATYVFGKLEIHFWLSTSVSRTTVFSQIAVYADMAVWLVIAATQITASDAAPSPSDSSVNF